MVLSSIYHFVLHPVDHRGHPKIHRFDIFELVRYIFVYQQYTSWDLDDENLFHAIDLEDYCSISLGNHQPILDESSIFEEHKLERYRCP